jgi:hypothetical protein
MSHDIVMREITPHLESSRMLIIVVNQICLIDEYIVDTLYGTNYRCRLSCDHWLWPCVVKYLASGRGIGTRYTWNAFVNV